MDSEPLGWGRRKVWITMHISGINCSQPTNTLMITIQNYIISLCHHRLAVQSADSFLKLLFTEKTVLHQPERIAIVKLTSVWYQSLDMRHNNARSSRKDCTHPRVHVHAAQLFTKVQLSLGFQQMSHWYSRKCIMSSCAYLPALLLLPGVFMTHNTHTHMYAPAHLLPHPGNAQHASSGVCSCSRCKWAGCLTVLLIHSH